MTIRRLAPLVASLLGVGAAHCNSNPPPESQTPSTAQPPPSSEPVAVTPTPAPSASAMPPASDTSASSGASGSISAEITTRFAHDSNLFGFDLYQRVRTQKGNIVVSPASITTALTMAWAGAKGDTADQMRKVLHLEGTPQEVLQSAGKLSSALQEPTRPIKFRIANRLFGEKTYKFESPFLESTKAAFGAPLEAVDFIKAPEPTRVRINAWVEEQTEKRIKDLIPAGTIKPDSRLVLVNALYFLGDWQTPFDKEKTKPSPFHVNATTKKDVSTMRREDRLRFVQQDGLKALEIGYKGGQMSMLFVLPDKVDGVEALEKSLDNGKIADLVSALKPQTVNVEVPKFEINPSASLALGDRLQEMGMTLAFNRRTADFTGIANPPSPDDKLYISQVFHKAFVKVDEKGTEAAAASAVVMMRATAMPMPEKVAQFHADHPFLFFIRDNATGMILFNGRVADPSAK
ncbi:serpin family protein [Pendulispora brunnea]|uniref:Serpin family protein n=1 Tax=Pendulispora brunnea TaxID=2905690 RepID=A0ABZ2JU16_9BACT